MAKEYSIQLIHKKFKTPKYYNGDDRPPTPHLHKAIVHAKKAHADAEARLVRQQWGVSTKVVPAAPQPAINKTVVSKYAGPGGKKVK